VSTVTHHVKKFMKEYEQSIGTPFINQQRGMEVDHLKVQRPVGLPLPAGRTVPLGGVGTKDTEFHLRKKSMLVFIEVEQGLHDHQNIPPQVLEEPILGEISIGHESNLTTNDDRLGVLL
jgi:hypothetical protein